MDSTVFPAPPAVVQEPVLDRPFSAFSISALSLRDSIVSLVRRQLGTKYRRGGESPKHGFDCSGLVHYVMSALNVELPRTAKDQAKSGQLIPRDASSLKPGDLLTFGFDKKISHIGIYVGDGRFVHASSAAGRVIESPLDRPVVRRVKPWRGARRVIPEDSVVAQSPAAAPENPTEAAANPTGRD